MKIGPEYVQMMARYNAEMNRRLYDAAARLNDAERRGERGAFWGSIHGTLAHVLWGDRLWMSRFDGWEVPAVPMGDSAQLDLDFAALTADRVAADARIEAWAACVPAGWLGEDLTWFSGAAQREKTKPLDLLVVHFFNHQTHHRGQVHAMLTAMGQVTGDTDLPLVV